MIINFRIFSKRPRTTLRRRHWGDLGKLASWVNQYSNVLGGNWDLTDKILSSESVNSFSHDLLHTCTCKAFPKEITTRVWF